MRTLLIGISLFLTGAIYAQSPVGSWVASGTSDDGQSWQWKVTLKADNTYDVDLGNDGSADMTGKYTVEGKQITVWNVTGEGCKGKGVYMFEVESDKIWMDPVSDECADRKPPEKVSLAKAN